MPLHDSTDLPGWEGMHICWMTEIARARRGNLPTGSRAVIGEPEIPVATAFDEPVFVADVPAPEFTDTAIEFEPEPATIRVQRGECLVAAIGLISPNDKAKARRRDRYAARCLDYLRGGVHLLIVDVHPRPLDFGFAQLSAAELDPALPKPAAPSAVSYRVGATAAQGGRMVGVWQYALAIGQPLPAVVLPLTPDDWVSVELEETYSRAAADSYVT